MAAVDFREIIDSLKDELQDLVRAVSDLRADFDSNYCIRVARRSSHFRTHMNDLLTLLLEYFKTTQIEGPKLFFRRKLKEVSKVFVEVFYDDEQAFERFYKGFNEALLGDVEAGLDKLNFNIDFVELESQSLLNRVLDVIKVWESTDPLIKTISLIKSAGLDRNWMIASVCLTVQEITAKRKMKELGATHDRSVKMSVFRQLENAYKKKGIDCPEVVSYVDKWTETRARLIHEGKKTSPAIAKHVLQDTDTLMKELSRPSK